MAVILCSPTGSGKTVTFADIARDSVKAGGVVMIAVDRSELLDQAKHKLVEYGLNPSIIKSGKTMRHGANCYVATVQTLKRRVFPEINLLIVDEAHKQIFDPVIKIYKEAGVFVIGATATPIRTGNMTQLSDLYDEIVEAVTIEELIAQGFLVPAITVSVKMDAKIKVKGGEYDNKAMFDAFDKRALYDGVVDKYKHFFDGTKAICFNVNVEHSKKVTQAFNDAGISAVHVDGSTPKAQRDAIFSAFKKGAFQVLCNVDLATTGFDEWTIETVIVNRMTLSLALWLQMCGRGSRITPEPLQGVAGWLQKSHFNILDMAGNVYKLGFWEQPRTWKLTHQKSDTVGIAPVRECPEDQFDANQRQGCGAMLHASAPSCKHCGFIFERKEKSFMEGEFIQIENYDLLPPELIGKAWGSMTFEELEKVKKAKGFKFGWIVQQIVMSKDLDLLEFARYKGYENPEGWVRQMTRFHKTPPAPFAPEFYYYMHQESDTIWKQKTPFINETDQEIDELTKQEYVKKLEALGLVDSDELIYI